jgi:hypothetical protein
MVTGLGTHAVGQERGTPSSNVRILDAPGKKRVEISGGLFTEYRYQDQRQPILYPVLGPGGVRMTRDFPMGITEGEARDHPHQQSLWFAHGDVNGRDFWSGGDGSRIVHAGFLPVAGTDAIRVMNRWEDGDGKVICEDERLLRFGGGDTARWIDYAVTIHASKGAITLGDTKEGTMGIRMAASLRLAGPVAEGSAVNSEGLTDGDVWGERAKWIDYFGPVGEGVVGIAIFDHPDNPRHPTWWHARDYGLCAANPFGVHDFEGAAAGTGDLVVEDGEKVTFRYRFYFHLGDAVEAGVAEQYEVFVVGTGPKEQE